MADDLFERIDAAVREETVAAQKVDELAKRLGEIAGKVRSWRQYQFTGKLADGTAVRPSDGPDGQIDINMHLPTLDEICVAQQKWLDATEQLQRLVDDATPQQMEWIQSKHPELKKSGHVRYKDLG